MRKTITIKAIEVIKAKSGRMYNNYITANDGNMSCFIDDIIPQLQTSVNEQIDVEIEFRGTDGKFKNIVKFYGKSNLPINRPIEQKIIVNGLAEVDRADMEKWIKCLLKAANYLERYK